MSQGSDIQPQEVGGLEEIVLGCRGQEVCFLIPNHVEVSVVTDTLLGVFPLLLRPLGLSEETVGKSLEITTESSHVGPQLCLLCLLHLIEVQRDDDSGVGGWPHLSDGLHHVVAGEDDHAVLEGEKVLHVV